MDLDEIERRMNAAAQEMRWDRHSTDDEVAAKMRREVAVNIGVPEDCVTVAFDRASAHLDVTLREPPQPREVTIDIAAVPL